MASPRGIAEQPASHFDHCWRQKRQVQDGTVQERNLCDVPVVHFLAEGGADRVQQRCGGLHVDAILDGEAPDF